MWWNRCAAGVGGEIGWEPAPTKIGRDNLLLVHNRRHELCKLLRLQNCSPRRLPPGPLFGTRYFAGLVAPSRAREPSPGPSTLTRKISRKRENRKKEQNKNQTQTPRANPTIVSGPIQPEIGPPPLAAQRWSNNITPIPQLWPPAACFGLSSACGHPPSRPARLASLSAPNELHRHQHPFQRSPRSQK